MEGRMKKYRPLSPERAKVWTEKSPKYRQKQQPRKEQESSNNNRVAVVYYLCRNRQLEHPHFIEVPLSSPDGLYLRDVIERLNVLRGRGMASMYSWSCKRSYKNGFVWHDLSEDDLILPAHGNEYVLKGSELLEESNLGSFSPGRNVRFQNPKLLPEPPSATSQDDSSSSSSMNGGRGTKPSQDDELSPPVERPNSSAVSPESGKNFSWNGSLSLAEYKVYKNDVSADASTQTEENPSRNNSVRETCTRGVSTDDGSPEPESNGGNDSQHVLQIKESSEICKEAAVSPPPSTSSVSSGGRTDTLESLIRSDISKLNSFRILEEEEFRVPTTKLKPSNMLMQLISCGSISVKDHSFGLIPMYKPRFSHSKFPSPLFSTSLTLGELDCLTENPRLMGLRLEDKEYFSGSLIETNVPKGVAVLKRSSSFNADRTNKQIDPVEDKEDVSSTGSKCIPRAIKVSLSKHPRSESMRSPISEGPRISSEGSSENPQAITFDTSTGGSRRITEPTSGKKQSKRAESFREEGNVIKIEERLASGARVIIQSKGSPDKEDIPA